MNYCDLFGGVDEVKKIIAHAVSIRRQAHGLTCEELDKLVGHDGSPKYPRSVDFEKEPSLVNSNVYTTILNHRFGVYLKDILPIIDMREKKVGLVGDVAAGISLEKQVPKMITLAVLGEIDIARM